MGPVGVGRRAVKEGGYGLTTVPLVLPYPTPQKPGTQVCECAVHDARGFRPSARSASGLRNSYELRSRLLYKSLPDELAKRRSPDIGASGK